MTRQIPRLAESPAALVARERFFPGVDPLSITINHVSISIA